MTEQTIEKKIEAPDPTYLAAVLRHRQAMQAQLDRANALFAEVDTEATALLDQQYKATKSIKADVTLGDPGETKFATVTRVGGEAEAQVTDRDRFGAWVRDTYPKHWDYRIIPAREEVVLDDAFVDQVLASVNAAGAARYMDPETGELHDVPGVAIRPTRRRYFRWLFTRASKRQPLDGRELADEAMRSGRIDLNAPPALAPAPPAAPERSTDAPEGSTPEPERSTPAPRSRIGRRFSAAYDGECQGCGGEFHEGDEVAYVDDELCCEACVGAAA